MALAAPILVEARRFPVGLLLVAAPMLLLVVFVLVAVAVASVVDLAARRSAEAYRSRAEASALASVSRSVLQGGDTAEAVVDRVRETFGQGSVALLERADVGTWACVASSGTEPAATPSDADTVADVDDHRVLALRGRPLPAGDRRALEAFASQAAIRVVDCGPPVVDTLWLIHRAEWPLSARAQRAVALLRERVDAPRPRAFGGERVRQRTGASVGA